MAPKVANCHIQWHHLVVASGNLNALVERIVSLTIGFSDFLWTYPFFG
jgi:hypothetical protein